MNPDAPLPKVTPYRAASTGLGSKEALFQTGRLNRFFDQKHREISRRRFLNDLAVVVGFIGDALFFLIGMQLAYLLRFETSLFSTALKFDPPQPNYLSYMLVGMALFCTMALVSGTYQHGLSLRIRRTSWYLLRAVACWVLLFLLIALSFNMTPTLSWIFVGLSAINGGALLLSWRIILQRLFLREDIAVILRQHIVVVGWNQEADRLYKAVRSDGAQPFEIVGCVVPAHDRFKMEPPGEIPVLGSYEDLESILYRYKADVLLVCDVETLQDERLQLEELCERCFVQFKIIPSFFQVFLSRLHLETVSGVPVLGVRRLPMSSLVNRAIKRAVDIIGAIVGLTVFSPVIAVFALLIYRESPGPIFFKQARRGRDGHIFKMIKLRSMHLGAEKQDHLNQSTLRNDPRMLKIGKLMRRLNIDEMPQFWNVLKGEMSLVGPRPERIKHASKLDREIRYYNARHHVKPGITGWAQVHGLRGDTDLQARIHHDLYYIENWSLVLDIYIMVMTFFRFKNAY